MPVKRGFGMRQDRYALVVYLTQDEHRRVTQAAALADRSGAAFVRQCLNTALLDAGVMPLREETRHRITLAMRERIGVLAAAAVPTRVIASRLGCSIQVAYWWGKRRQRRVAA